MPSVSISIAAASAGMQMYEAHQGAKATEAEDAMKSRQASLTAGAQQIGIREKMLKALASQNAQAGQGGIGTGGSFGANVNRQIGQEGLDLQTNKANLSAQQQLFHLQDVNANRSANISMGTSLLDLGGAVAGSGVFNSTPSSTPSDGLGASYTGAGT